MFRPTDQHKESSEEMFGIKWITFTTLSTGGMKLLWNVKAILFFQLFCSILHSIEQVQQYRVDAYNQ